MPTTKVTTKMNSLKLSCIMNVICADETAQAAHALNKRYVYSLFLDVYSLFLDVEKTRTPKTSKDDARAQLSFYVYEKIKFVF